jgi:hypothetical protein
MSKKTRRRLDAPSNPDCRATRCTTLPPVPRSRAVLTMPLPLSSAVRLPIAQCFDAVMRYLTWRATFFNLVKDFQFLGTTELIRSGLQVQHARLMVRKVMPRPARLGAITARAWSSTARRYWSWSRSIRT